MTKYYTVTLSLPDGTRKYYRGKTKREAVEKREKERRLLCMGVSVQNRDTFKSFGEVWFDTYKKGRLHIRSEETILNILERYVYPVIGNLQLKEIKPMHIQMLMGAVKDYSRSTQSKVLQYTRAVLTAAVDNGLIERLPIPSTIKPTAPPPEEVKPLTDEQCSQLFEAVKGTRAYLFVLILRFCGLRKGEALGLMWSDVDFAKKELYVRRTVVYPESNKQGEIDTRMKTAQARRTIPLRDELLEILAEEKRYSTSLYMFSKTDGNFLSESSFRKMWDIITRRNLGFGVHPHQLRHTCITSWIEQGLGVEEVQHLAGHATPDITLRIYTHYREEQRREDTANRIRNSELNCRMG